MEKSIYVIRHCQATGQSADAPLTKKGLEQASRLVDFFQDIEIDRVFSSPYLRAVQTIEPLAKERNLEIIQDNRLMERELSTTFFADWMEKLEATFHDFDLTYEDGESSREAMNRIVEVFNEMVDTGLTNQLIVAHGGIISLLLHHFEPSFSFNDWKKMSNPDVFLLKVAGNDVIFNRLWEDN